MIRYIVRRLLLMIPVILIVAILIFTIMFFCPGDPATIILGAGAKDEEVEALRESMGLNDPFIVQLGRFMFQTFIKFDLGTSYMTGARIGQELLHRFPYTLKLSLAAMAIEVCVGIPLGMIAALHQNKVADRVCMIFAMVGISIPAFWLALLLMLLFSLRLGWLPSNGVEQLSGWILPIVCTCLNSLALMARQARSSMLDSIRADYVDTAKAKGLKKWTIQIRYMLMNALIPIVQTLGNGFATSLGGAIVIENVFSIPGIGSYITSSISSRDYNAIRGCVIILAIAFSLIMLGVDIAFAFIDPRIKAQYQNSGRRRSKKRQKEGVKANAA